MLNNPFVNPYEVCCQCCKSEDGLRNLNNKPNNFCGNCGAKIDWPVASLTDWNDTEQTLPKPGSFVIVKYEDNGEYDLCYGHNERWMDRDALCYYRTPEFWRYDPDFFER